MIQWGAWTAEIQLVSALMALDDGGHYIQKFVERYKISDLFFREGKRIHCAAESVSIRFQFLRF